MLRIAMAYAIDGASIAQKIKDKLADVGKEWEVSLYPVMEKDREFNFWPMVRFGYLKADVILFVATSNFIEQNQKHFDELKSGRAQHYRMASVFVKPRIVPQVIGEFCDLELEVSNDNDYELPKLKEYLQVVDVVVENNRAFKKERRNRSRKSSQTALGMLTAYIGIIVCAIAVLMESNSSWGKSSAEGLLVFTGVFAALLVSAFSYFAMETLRRKREQEDRTEFANELDSSLSKKPDIKRSSSDFLAAAVNMVDSPISYSYSIIETLLPIMNLKGTTDDVSKQKSHIEITDDMGGNDYLPLGHLKTNWKQIKEYYEISKRQAKSSFGWAIVISFVGVVILIFAMISPLFLAFSGSKSLLPILGTIGGAFVELFAGTILIVYMKSLAQMNYYHKALAEYQNYLSCVNLVSQITDTQKQDQIYEEIIRKQMNKVGIDKEEK